MDDFGGIVVILDFGSQYTQLIARRIRQLRVYCEIVPPTTTAEELAAMHPSALILSGGPASVYDPGAPALPDGLFELGLSTLGICYGQQLMARELGGKVVASEDREYGPAQATRLEKTSANGARLLAAFEPGEPFDVWMSHGDRIEALPEGFDPIATTPSTPYAAIAHRERPLFGLQFHPEVVHTPRGIAILEAFLFDVAGLEPRWTMSSFLGEEEARLRERVGENERVLCALSGGVDSSVVAALLGRALGDRVQCIFVDTGLLRRGEVQAVRELFGHALGLPLTVVDAGERFVSALAGVTDPEEKRKRIGHLFIEVFEEESRRIEGVRYLAQGTLYPDVIESTSHKGPSATIKSHHNVGGLPERMRLELIEPLRELFKDEVRLLGAELGLPERLCRRQPFPGPGLAVRIAGEVTAERVVRVRHADAIVEEEILRSGLEARLWQSFAILLPTRSVGVMGDERTYDETIVVRAVESTDGMTADWARLPHDLLARISSRISNEVRGVGRVLFDISSKPPATIEWE